MSGGRTRVFSKDLKDGQVKRDDVNIDEAGQALITKALEGSSIEITETGSDEGTGDVTINVKPHGHLHLMQLSGRFEIDADSDWACWSDINFGPSLQDWDLDLADSGTGGIPAVDWDGLGLAFPAGSILKRMFVKCRGNNTDIDSIQTYVRMHDVDLTAGNPIDSNAEIGAVEVSGITTFDLDAGAGSSNDVRGFEILLGDYEVQNDGADMHFMVKAANGSLTGNRQLRCTVFIEYYLPNDLEDNS